MFKSNGYKSHQFKGKVTTQIHVPKEHESELAHLVSLALFGTLGISSFPNRNLSLIILPLGRNCCSFPDIGEVDNINRVLQRSGTEQLDTFLLLLWHLTCS